ncbi:MAG: S8 family serine peptidase [Bacteroidota bacterium]|nr:S8 family serine peptidase [Bacteroidota bacterium]
MKKIFTPIFCLTLVSIFAQTQKERAKIVNSYDKERVLNLKSELAKRNKLNKDRIAQFLIENPKFKKAIREQDGTLKEIKYIIDNQPIYIITHNAGSAEATRTNFLHPGGGLDLNLEGENMNIGVWDGDNVRATHSEFQSNDFTQGSRISSPDFGASDAYGNHATHVAGTIIATGINESAKGMAPKASVISYDWDADSVEAANESFDNGLLLSNHSYGIPVQQSDNLNYLMGSYGAESREWDAITHLAEYYLPVISAGNDGTTEYNGGLANNFDKLIGNKTSKNTLVVANARNPYILENGDLLFMNINSTSSQGPTDDGRIKPDISGDGTSVFSTVASTDNSYGSMTGTSMSAPNISGSLLLLQEYYNQLNGFFMKASTLKALVCHTADDDNTVGPDPVFGWGLLNAKFAAETIQDDNNNLAQIHEGSLNSGETYTYSLSCGSGGPLKATLCWTDPPGSVNNTLNSPSPALVNDLDLRVSGNGTTYFPWKLDANNPQSWATKGDNIVDTVEGIQINSAQSGNYTITVSNKGSLLDGLQNFSLVITGPNLVLSDAALDATALVIWPNPAKDVINFQYPSASQKVTHVTLSDLQGRVVYKSNLSSLDGLLRGQIKTSTFSKGFYILNLRQGNSVINQKIILK